VHAVRLIDESLSPVALSVASLSSSFALSAEAEGRTYGGGVLKLEPSEAERLLLPRLTPADVGELEAIFGKVDALVRRSRLDEASRIVDDVLGLDHDKYVLAARDFHSRRSLIARSHSRKPLKNAESNGVSRLSRRVEPPAE
jgi:hypothetical protein